MISTEPVEIIGITETWVDTAGRDFEGQYRLPGYSLFHQDRAGRAGGGVMLYAREFNTYFINVFTVEDVDNIPDPVIVHAGENTLTDIDCAEPEFEAKLKELKPDKAAGSDGLPKVLKAVMGGVVPHLCQIFNRSFTTAEVPQDFQSADFCPIPKKGLLTDMGNYDPSA